MKFKSRYLASLVVSLIGLFALTCPSARGAYVVMMSEIGPNVFATGSGSLDFSSLAFDNTGFIPTATVVPTSAVLRLGSGSFTSYTGASGPTNFGGGSGLNASSQTGNLVSIQGFNGFLLLPTGYASGTALGTSTATWNNASFASLGVTPGTYVWNWGSGPTADNFTLQIVPEPATWLLLGVGAAVFAVARRRRA